MKKFLLILLGIIILLLVCSIFAWKSLPSILSHKLSKEAGAQVSIENVSMNSHGIEISQLKIQNPPDYSKTARALSVRKLKVKSSLTQVFNHPLILDEIALSDIFVGLEFDSPMSSHGNWSYILGNIKEASSKEKNKSSEPQTEREVQIKTLVIQNLQIELAYKNGTKPIKKLKPIKGIRLTNLKSRGGLPIGQIVHLVMQEMLQKALSEEGVESFFNEIISPKESKKGLMKTFKSLFTSAYDPALDRAAFES